MYYLHQRCFVTLCTAISLWTVLNHLSALSHMPLIHEILFRTYVASNARNYDLGERFREIYTFLSNEHVRKRVRNYRKLNGKPISRKCHNVLDEYWDEDHFSKYLQEKKCWEWFHILDFSCKFNLPFNL